MQNNKFAVVTLSFFISLIGFICLFVYWGSLNNQLLTWDTDGYVTFNNNIKTLDFNMVKWAFSSFYMSNWHPLTWISHAIDYYFFGLSPRGHHLTNVVFHLINSFLMLWTTILLSFLVTQQNPTIKAVTLVKNQPILLISGLTALMFSIHPQHVESVVWVAERKDVLSTFFILLTVCCYIFYLTKKNHSSRFYMGSVFFAVCAFMSKPMAVSLPIILLIIDLLVARRKIFPWMTHLSEIKKIVLEKLPFCIFSVILVILTLLAQSDGGTIVPVENLSISRRFFTAFYNIFFYFEKWLLPFNLSPYYSYTEYNPFQGNLSIIPILFFIAVTVISLYQWIKLKTPYFFAGWLFYFFTLLPVVGVVQVGEQGAADRYAYLPTMPFYMLSSYFMVHLFYHYRKVGQFFVVVTLSLYISWLSFLTIRQVPIWHDDPTFWLHSVLQNPKDVRLKIYLGEVYFRREMFKEAEEQYFAVNQMIDWDRQLNIFLFYKNYAISLMKLGKYKRSLEVYHYILKHKIQVSIRDEKIFFNMAMLYAQIKKPELAIEYLNKILVTEPENTKVIKMLEKIKNDYGLN